MPASLKTMTSLFCGFLIVISCFFINPFFAHAATPTQSDLVSTLSSLKVTLISLQQRLLGGKVLGAQTIVVNNDVELRNALATVTGGETIQLNPGKYGKIIINEGQYSKIVVGSATGAKRVSKLSSPVTVISADASNQATIAALQVVGSPMWRFESLTVRPAARQLGVDIQASNNIVFTKNNITYADDSSGWDATTWNNTTGVAVDVRSGSNNVEISNNYLKNVAFGINIYHGASNARVIGNTVDSFNGDGMRGLGDNGLFENNLIKNPVLTNGNHPDGFQSWRDYANSDRPVDGVTVRNNTFLALGNYPLAAPMQGVGMFDGPFKNWTITNNLIVANTWHGIMVSGGIDSTIKNNVVVDPTQATPGPTWIGFGYTKAGSSTINSFLTDNYTTKINNPSPGVTQSGNVIISFSQYDQYFVDYRNGNWNLKSGAVPFSAGANQNGSTTPTVTLTATPSSITTGASATLAWTSTNASSCTGTGTGFATGNAISGSDSVTPTVTTSYTVTCTGTGGSISDTKLITVTTAIPLPALVGITLAFDTKVYRYPAQQLIETQIKGTVGTYDSSITPILKKNKKWVYVDFVSGKDGYVDMAMFIATIATTEVASLATTVITTDIVRVRKSPNGDILATQPRGMTGSTYSIESAVVGGYKWLYVNFLSGQDGYVATVLLHQKITTSQKSIQNELLEKIKKLQTQIATLQKLEICCTRRWPNLG